MDVDESFAEYVAARWSMLYRLATLLAGTDGADELTQTTLVRAYLAWPEVQAAASADDHVKRILADTAVKMRGLGADPRVDEDSLVRSPGREKLWAAISELPPRQRAVLVLRHYERLSNAEIGDAVGCSTSTVAAEALALETGLDLADLRNEFVLRSDEASVPFPPVDFLLTRGRHARRQRRRRSWGWAAAAAAVVAVGLVLTSVVQDTTSGQTDRTPPTPPTASTAAVPRFLSMLPSGRPPRVAYSVRRSLHLGSGREVALADKPSAIVQTKKWLFVAYLSGEIVRFDLGAAEAQTVVGTSHGELVTDPAGEHVAWLAAGAGPAVVVVRTVADGAVLASDEQTFPAEPRCCDNPFVVNGMTQDGKVVASLPAANRAWVWDTPDAGTESQVQEISGLGNGVVSQVTSDGIAVHYPPFQYAVGRLDDGFFLQRAELAALDADFGDPLGHRVVYADAAGEIHVRESVLRGRSRRGSQNVTMVLPTLADGFSTARWEDTDHVLLDVSDASLPDGGLVRCDVHSGACEVAARFDGPHLVAD